MRDMTDWKQKIEAQIAAMRETGVQAYTWNGNSWPDTMQALLDVAVAADAMERKGRAGNACGEIGAYHAMCDALDKLREGE